MSNDKQERIVCAAVKITFANGGEKDEVVMPYIKSHKDEYHIFLLLIKLGIWRTKRYTEEFGFATSNQRFVDAREAMQIAIKGGQIKELAELDLIIREFEEYEEESGIETNQLIAARESYGEFYHQFSCRELKPEDLY